MSVTPLSASRDDFIRLEGEFVSHRQEDREEFKSVRRELADGLSENTQAIAELHGSVDVLVTAFGLRNVNQDPPTIKKPVGLMSKSALLWQVGGAMGGLLIVEKIVVAIGPMTWQFIVSAAKIVAHVQ